MRKKHFRHIFFLLVFIVSCTQAFAQDNNRILNRPYADNRLMHLGFSVGMHFQDLQFTHNGFITEDGQSWYMEVPGFSPGFNVTVLGDLRLGKYFNLRFTPGMYFGNKVVHMRDVNSGEEITQNVRSNMVVLPLDLKMSSERYRNIRPYATAGIMATFDVSKKRVEPLKFNTTDFFITVGIGCDFYLPFFKLSPEIKYCFGLTDALQHKRPDLSDDPATMKYTNSLSKAVQQMLVLSFYFE